MTTQLPSINEKIYRLANHIAGAKGGLPAEWQDWAEEIETDLRTLLVGMEQEPVAYSLIFRNSDGVSTNHINTMTTFSTYAEASAYSPGGRFVTQEDGKIKWIRDKALDPIVVPLYAAPVVSQPAPVAVPECFQRLLKHSHGMSMGVDWNNGTSSGFHREKLLEAVKDCRAAMQLGTINNEDTNQEQSRIDEAVDLFKRAAPQMLAKKDPGGALVGRIKPNSPAIPDGWKLVPIEPTMAILDEFDSIIDYGAEDSKDAWRRLIDAAPQPGANDE